MNSVSLKAYAKINIGLDITGKREDGYHLLKTCMQTVDIYDVVTIGIRNEKTGPDIRLSVSSPAVPCDKTNIAWKACEVFCRRYNINAKVDIDIQKNIPVSAGLAGGSTDGAAVLKALRLLLKPELSLEELEEPAKELGADVPFCLHRGLRLCEGTGEILSELRKIEGVSAVIVKPPFGISTAWCYKEYDRLQTAHPDMNGLLKAINEKDTKRICALLGNCLEEAVCPSYEQIAQIKSELLLSGADGAQMSGSGSAVYGLFTDRKKAREAHRAFKKAYSEKGCFLADLIY